MVDAAVEVKGACPLDCQDTCCWVANVEDGRVVKVSGARGHPFTRGVLCAKVKDYEARTYSADRVLHPLRRVGAKGAGEFERISWDAAIDEIADRFTSIIDGHGAEALFPLFFLGSLGAVQHDALRRLFHFVGASRPVGSVCGQSGNAVAAEGYPRGFDPEEIAEAEFVIVWGANLLTTAHHHWRVVTEARKHRGARIVVIDPVRTRTAAAADEHVAIRPGTDHILALGVARELIAAGLADLDAARSWATEVDEFVEGLERWTPDVVGKRCGIAPDTVIGLANGLGAASPGVVRVGIGVQQSSRGDEFMRAVSALAVVSGHLGQRGGGIFVEAYPDFDGTKTAGASLGPPSTREIDIARLGPLLVNRELRPPLCGLMAWNMNPAVSLPDTALVRQGLARDDLFTVVIEHFITDTAAYADIVLPSTTQLEHFDILGAWGHHYISVNNPAIEPLGESRSHGEIMRMLAERMGLDHPALRATDEEIAASGLPEHVDLDRLKAEGWVKTTRPRPTPPDANNRIRLTGALTADVDATESDELQLLTPKSQFFMNSSFANMPRQRTAMGPPTIHVHPDDAAERGLSDGQHVEVANAQGHVTAILRITSELRRGVAALPGKWWSTPESTDAVANLLTPSAWSPGGQPAFNDTFITLSPISKPPDN